MCVEDHPGGGGVMAAVLPRVTAQPLVERRVAGLEAGAVVSLGVERGGAAELSQTS